MFTSASEWDNIPMSYVLQYGYLRRIVARSAMVCHEMHGQNWHRMPRSRTKFEQYVRVKSAPTDIVRGSRLQINEVNEPERESTIPQLQLKHVRTSEESKLIPRLV